MLQGGIDSRRKFLDGLGTQLKGLKRASMPLQQHLELPISLEEQRKHAARLLPPPLYVLYTQLAAGSRPRPRVTRSFAARLLRHVLITDVCMYTCTHMVYIHGDTLVMRGVETACQASRVACRVKAAAAH